VLDAVLLLARVAIGMVFLYAALLKMMRPYDFLSDVYAYEILGPQFGVLLATTLPALEMAVGVCLMTGIFLEGALVAGGSLFAVFFVAQCLAVWRGLEISCGCFSAGQGGGDTIGHLTVLRTGFLLVSAFSVLIRVAAVGQRKSILHVGV